MRRVETYVGSQVYEWVDSAQAQNTMTAIAKVCAALFGTNGVVNGLTCIPTSPATMTVQFGAGEVYQMAYIEATASGTLPANTAYSILKQGIQFGTYTTSTFTTPSTAGQSINYLVQVQYQDSDLSLDPTTGNSPVVLQFYNSTNPATPWSGPNNSGSTSNTFRDGIVAYSIVAGVAATTGSQVTPTPSAGWIPISVVTVPYGASSLTATNISVYPGASILPAAGLLVGAVQQDACTTSVAGGTADALTGNFFPAITTSTLASGVVQLGVRASSANATTTPTFTPNAGVVTPATIVKGSGQALAAGDIAGAGHWIWLTWDATLSKWVLLNPATGVSVSTGYGAPIIISAATTLTAAQATNKYVQVGGSGNYTVTLPAASAVTAGSVVAFWASQPNITISRAGTDVIYVNNATVNTLTLNLGDTLLLCSNGAGTWFPVSGSSLAIYNRILLQYSASQTLNASQSGSIVEVSGATTTITLPAPSTANLGFKFYNSGSAAVTISTPSGGIYSGGTSASTLSLYVAGTLELFSDGTNWIAVNGTTIGLGSNQQTWTDVTASRAFGTTYTNSTGRPIMVMVTGTGNNSATPGYMTPIVGSVTLGKSTTSVANGSWTGLPWSQSFVVQPGQTYSVTGSNTTLSTWTEMR